MPNALDPTVAAVLIFFRGRPTVEAGVVS
jgi:hypothetical protein